MTSRVLIADDYMMIRQLLENTIAASGEFSLCASLPSAAMAVEYCAKNTVDLVILDVLFPGGMSGMEAARLIRQSSSHTKILMITSMPEAGYLRQAREIGVDSFWHKEIQQQPILEIMRRTIAGESIYPAYSPVVTLGNAKSTEFTEREIEVLRELVGGASNKEISETLFISEKTVKNHISSMLEKTGFRSRLELAVSARDIGFVIK